MYESWLVIRDMAPFVIFYNVELSILKDVVINRLIN